MSASSAYAKASIDCVGWLVSLQCAISQRIPLFYVAPRNEDIAAAIEAVLERRADALEAIALACRKRVKASFRRQDRLTHGRRAFVECVRSWSVIATVCEHARNELTPILEQSLDFRRQA
jgi:hypothetical protein